MRLRTVTAGLFLTLAAVACAAPGEPVASGGVDSPTPTPEVPGSATLVTPSPDPTQARSPSPKPTPKPTHSTPTTPPAGNKRVVVTESNTGQTIRLRVGDTLEVRLGSEYHPASTRPAGVLARSSTSGGYPSSQPMVAVFKAQAKGNADVESSTDYACLHATPSCAIPQHLWSVHVVVT